MKTNLLQLRAMLFSAVVLAFFAPISLGINGDSYADLLVGVEYEQIGSILQAGGFHTIYGTSTGLSDEDNQFFSQEDLGTEDPCEAMDSFAKVLTTGDFNGDSFSDLAIGTPSENFGDISNAGVVQVIYGSLQGFQLLNPAPDYFSQDTQGIPGAVEDGDRFGWALAAGDFNHDGYDDLAISAPFDAIGSLSAAGAVFVIPGSATGLITPDTQMFEQSDLGTENPTEQSDQFGEALASGDINGDGYTDLVIGSRGESIDEAGVSEGCIHLMYGSAMGLAVTGAQCFWQGMNSDVAGVPEEWDTFGGQLATGDVNGDGFDEIAVSSWGEDVSGIGTNVGMVHVFYGSVAGAITTGCQSTYPSVEDGEFGQSLAMGDIDGNGLMDLIVGSTGFDAEGMNHAGAIYIYYGSTQGLDISTHTFYYLGDGFIQGEPAEMDQFGYGVVSADFNGDGFWDIAASAISEDIDSIDGAGAVHILRGSANGITADGAQTWTQNTGDIAGVCESGDFFGSSLAVSKTRSQPSTCTETGVSIEMPGTSFQPGDTCGCTVTVCNAESTSIANPLFVILDVAGSYYFAPTFSAYDNYFTQIPNFAPGSMTVTVLSPFTWPTGTGSFSGCKWYAALTDPNVTQLVGVMDSWTFGWTE